MGVVNTSMDDAELEQLLTQLLRVVSPAPPGEPPGSARVADGLATSVHSASTDTQSANPRAPGSRAAQEPGSPEPASQEPGAQEPGALEPGSREPGSRQRVDIPAVSASEARALIELVSARGIAQGELAGLLSLEKSTVSRLAAGLERKGWIRRGRDGENQRYVRLYLTPEGRAVATQVWTAWQSRQARILGALSAEERAGLSAGLRGLVRGLAAEGLLGEAPARD
jgi:DNA-binding MarR family transcriptional regulator